MPDRKIRFGIDDSALGADIRKIQETLSKANLTLTVKLKVDVGGGKVIDFSDIGKGVVSGIGSISGKGPVLGASGEPARDAIDRIHEAEAKKAEANRWAAMAPGGGPGFGRMLSATQFQSDVGARYAGPDLNKLLDRKLREATGRGDDTTSAMLQGLRPEIERINDGFKKLREETDQLAKQFKTASDEEKKGIRDKLVAATQQKEQLADEAKSIQETLSGKGGFLNKLLSGMSAIGIASMAVQGIGAALDLPVSRERAAGAMAMGTAADISAISGGSLKDFARMGERDRAERGRTHSQFMSLGGSGLAGMGVASAALLAAGILGAPITGGLSLGLTAAAGAGGAAWNFFGSKSYQTAGQAGFEETMKNIQAQLEPHEKFIDAAQNIGRMEASTARMAGMRYGSMLGVRDASFESTMMKTGLLDTDLFNIVGGMGKLGVGNMGAGRAGRLMGGIAQMSAGTGMEGGAITGILSSIRGMGGNQEGDLNLLRRAVAMGTAEGIKGSELTQMYSNFLSQSAQQAAGGFGAGAGAFGFAATSVGMATRAGLEGESAIRAGQAFGGRINAISTAQSGIEGVSNWTAVQSAVNKHASNLSPRDRAGLISYLTRLTPGQMASPRLRKVLEGAGVKNVDEMVSEISGGRIKGVMGAGIFLGPGGGSDLMKKLYADIAMGSTGEVDVTSSMVEQYAGGGISTKDQQRLVAEGQKQLEGLATSHARAAPVRRDVLDRATALEMELKGRTELNSLIQQDLKLRKEAIALEHEYLKDMPKVNLLFDAFIQNVKKLKKEMGMPTTIRVGAGGAPA